MKVAIIDTNCANLQSVCNAISRIDDVTYFVSNDIKELNSADKLILPGVGTASHVMQGVMQYDLRDFILNTKKDLLGICLGMQILGAKSYEVPKDSAVDFVETLNIVDADVKKLEVLNETLPHMGWNSIKVNAHPIFKDIEDNSYFYFVHSYAMGLCANTIATCNYHKDFSAAICKDNFVGVQFHPEKSGALGHKLLCNFVFM